MHPNKLTLLGMIVLAASCGPDKGKPDLATDGKTFEAAESALRTTGNWRLIETVESAHPYADRFFRLWQVNADPGTVEMLVVFDRFELESGFDYLSDISQMDGAHPCPWAWIPAL